jgi:hypothetical protein
LLGLFNCGQGFSLLSPTHLFACLLIFPGSVYCCDADYDDDVEVLSVSCTSHGHSVAGCVLLLLFMLSG